MKAQKTAIVLIEFQNEFCKDGGKLHDMVKDEIARQKTVEHAIELAQGARQKGALIVHCGFVFDEQWVDDKCVCGIIAGAKEGGAFRPGDWGTEFIDELKPQEGDVVLEGKRALSGFTNTGLDEILQQHGIENVVIAGFLSNVCVEATSRSAYDRGYKVCVAKDATAAASEQNQQYVEREIYPILGEAKTSEQIVSELEE
ncbi:MAG: cysteine hydrolase [Planctomycetes bacterium]|nr:cysteine hydrolase [Planctomycetota bacterium]MBL7042898.1 cysteine hydrolase [Pirellulaceae bacterium]